MDCSEILTGEFEYELIDISWSLDYDFGSMPHATHVADEGEMHASKSYKSTKSVFLIDNILKNARPIQRVDVKPGNANQSEFEYMLAMCYKIMELGTVKLMVGVKRKRDEKGISQKVQYSISVLNPEEPFIEQKNNNRGKNAKRKAPHRKR